MRIAAKVIGVAVLALLMVGCSAIDAGRVTKKTYSPPSSYTTMQCAGYNAQGFCSVYIPVVNYVPEQYTLSLEAGEETGWAYVDRYTFENTQIGDWYGEQQ